MDMPEVSIVLLYWASVHRHIWHRLVHINMCRLMHSTTLHKSDEKVPYVRHIPVPRLPDPVPQSLSRHDRAVAPPCPCQGVPDAQGHVAGPVDAPRPHEHLLLLLLLMLPAPSLLANCQPAQKRRTFCCSTSQKYPPEGIKKPALGLGGNFIMVLTSFIRPKVSNLSNFWCRNGFAKRQRQPRLCLRLQLSLKSLKKEKLIREIINLANH